MADSSESLKSVPIEEIEQTISDALSRLTPRRPIVDIRKLELFQKSSVDAVANVNYRIELIVTVPKHDDDFAIPF